MTADVAVAALSEVLETNDKQHLSITILLNDNQQLQDKLAASDTELSRIRLDKKAALDAHKDIQRLLADSQVPNLTFTACKQCMFC